MLQSNSRIKACLRQLLCDPEIHLIGQGVDREIKDLKTVLGMESPVGFYNINEMFLQVYPEESKSNLLYQVQKVLGKSLCKYM